MSENEDSAPISIWDWAEILELRARLLEAERENATLREEREALRLQLADKSDEAASLRDIARAANLQTTLSNESESRLRLQLDAAKAALSPHTVAVPHDPTSNSR